MGKENKKGHYSVPGYEKLMAVEAGPVIDSLKKRLSAYLEVLGILDGISFETNIEKILGDIEETNRVIADCPEARHSDFIAGLESEDIKRMRQSPDLEDARRKGYYIFLGYDGRIFELMDNMRTIIDTQKG